MPLFSALRRRGLAGDLPGLCPDAERGLSSHPGGHEAFQGGAHPLQAAGSTQGLGARWLSAWRPHVPMAGREKPCPEGPHVVRRLLLRRQLGQAVLRAQRLQRGDRARPASGREEQHRRVPGHSSGQRESRGAAQSCVRQGGLRPLDAVHGLPPGQEHARALLLRHGLGPRPVHLLRQRAPALGPLRRGRRRRPPRRPHSGASRWRRRGGASLLTGLCQEGHRQPARELAGRGGLHRLHRRLGVLQGGARHHAAGQLERGFQPPRGRRLRPLCRRSRRHGLHDCDGGLAGLHRAPGQRGWRRALRVLLQA
mmetsp:Transcript_40622/g.117296  ORF Transcript_40622/g.117296 Transcript_40622/m.117296 type:complete len:310 (-) Transcript_40622:1664-2593(-)